MTCTVDAWRFDDRVGAGPRIHHGQWLQIDIMLSLSFQMHIRGDCGR